MGRGRAKAKQQKVARELKYNTHFTDLDALQRELGATESAQMVTTRVTAAIASEAGREPMAASARHIADRRAPGRLAESPWSRHALG